MCVLMLKGGTGEAKSESYRGHAAVTLLDPHCRHHCRHQYFCHHISTEMFCSTECIASRCTSCPLNSFLFVLTFVVKFACCVYWLLLHITTLGTAVLCKKGKGSPSPYSVTERRVPELIPVLGSQPAGDVSYKPGGRLPLLSTRPAVTPTTFQRTATNFAAW